MNKSKRISKGLLWTSYIIKSILFVLFLRGALNYLLLSERTVSSVVEMGYPKTSIPYLGFVLLFANILYSIPKTTFVGALFLTAYLGGAVATHVINDDPILNILSPVIFGVFVWVGLWLGHDKFECKASPILICPEPVKR
ncbi:DoxX family protein [Olivibacter sp. SDN3]|uniref:DoxX family protein n=1 Tax=Olivibacter sp. SDN3 TaxID=2764720 RepID=UPI00165191BE|nr:DoxX family protein [Olivibacter sp. SDN3]QNL47772.1 DoxX family protein [Olivibacter sp. SDN3]